MTVSAPSNPLQEFYETPGVPLRSGPDRAQRQARMMTEMLRGVAGPAVIVDLGCGDGSALAVAAEHNPAHRVVGLDWSGGAPPQARAPGPAGGRGPGASGRCARAWPRTCRSRTAPRTW